jgi:hypothetical protein
MVKFNFKSRYTNTEQIVVDSKETVGVWNQPSYLITRPAEANILRFYVTSALEGRPDLIAYSVYGYAELDWVIVAFNNPPEILNWPRAGDLIEYPVGSLVYAEL